MDIENNNKLERAKKRVEKIKGFYIHLAVYIVINSFILVNVYISTMAEGESFWQFPTFFTLIFCALILRSLCEETSIHLFFRLVLLFIRCPGPMGGQMVYSKVGGRWGFDCFTGWPSRSIHRD